MKLYQGFTFYIFNDYLFFVKNKIRIKSNNEYCFIAFIQLLQINKFPL